MKFHVKPSNRSFAPFEQVIEIDNDNWSYISMGDRTFMRPPNLSGTYEANYYDIVGAMPPVGVCPQPEQDAVEDFIRTKVVPVYKEQVA